MSYEKPPMNNVPFKFTDTGYSAPDFQSVPFGFGLRPSTQQTADMRATIEVFGKYCDSTYTYLKEQKIYVIGYSSYGIQILKGKNIYGGIRDLCATLMRVPTHKDLPAYIDVVSNYLSLSAYIKSTIQSHADLIAEMYGIPPEDLPAFIHGFDTRNIPATIYGWAIKNLSAYIGTHPPSDLAAILNVIEIRDLPASITGEWWHSHYDLPAEFYKIWMREDKDLQSMITGWDELDLPAYIASVYFKDLLAIIQGSWTADLPATMYSIVPIDLQALIHGWATYDLGSVISGVYGPYDLQAYLNTIPSNDLGAYIRGFRGIQVPFNLRGIVEGWYTVDLLASLNLVFPVDLSAYLMATGKTYDLGAYIIPSTILMKRALQIPLLEHKDLDALINFMCFGSDYIDLNAYMYALHKLDLSAFIIGWYGGTADNLSELGAYINAGVYSVQDRVDIRYVPEIGKYTLLNIRFGSIDTYTTWDTIDILYGSYYAKNLTAYINGILTSSDLGASLTAIWDWNYSELPEYIRPKTHEVFINMERLEEQWSRFVELMFDREGNEPFKYFYVSGTQRVYKVDRSRHWTIWADGYNRTTDSMIERTNVRRKFIFKLSDYDTIDEAIRELMERAAYPTSAELGAYINGGLAPHLDLVASVFPIVKYTWVKHLSANLNIIEVCDLGAEIIGS